MIEYYTFLSSTSKSSSLFLQASSNHVCNSRFNDFHFPGDLSSCQTEVELHKKENKKELGNTSRLKIQYTWKKNRTENQNI